MMCKSRVIQRLARRVMRPASARRVADRAPLVRLPATYIEAARALADPAAFRRPAVLNRVDGGPSYEGTYPPLEAWSKAFLKELRRREIPFYLFEALRSRERQAQLKAQGRSKAGPGQSPHQYGLAVDLISATRYWDLTRREWDVIAAIGKEVARKRGLKVEWGGDWKFYDAAHWQVQGWRNIKGWPDMSDTQIKAALRAK